MDEETKQIATQAIAALVRHGLTVLSGVLVSDGLLQSAQVTNFTEIGVGIAAGVLGYGWSVLNKRKLVKAVVTGEPNA